VSELAGLLLLLAGVGALAATGSLVACCLRLRSTIEFALAVYLVAWGWLVAVTLALSPLRWVTRWSLVGGMGAGLLCALAAWVACGRPSPPSFGRALAGCRDALRNPAVLVLAVAVSLGTLYVGALAFFTPANDWDVLAYHLARASFWKQEHGLGYIDNAGDWRLNLNPPNAEIGQLATMLLSGRDRYAALPQLSAYAALALCVAGLARRLGFATRDAVFAALAFATLPVVALQASGALNDLVVASFLTAAAFFALGTGLAPLLMLGLAVALAIGTKFTALIALPLLALVAAVGRRPRRWPELAIAGVAGLAAGSAWYLVNAAETGALDGGAGDISGQRAELDGAATATTAMRLGLSFVDMSGAPWPTSLLFLVPASVLAAVSLFQARRGRSPNVALLTAAAVTAGVIAAPLIWELGVRAVFKLALLIGAEDALLDQIGWALNTKPEPTLAWYGPVASLLLAIGSAMIVVAWRRREVSTVALALAAAPWVLLLTLALTIAWDPWRGRFLLFGVALAAATWGVVLRSSALALATAAIGSTALFLTLAGYEGKPSGLLSEPTIWGNARWEAQARLSGSTEVLRFVEESVPEDSRIGLSLIGDHHVHPYFGPRLSRHVWLIPSDSGSPPADANWLVLAPSTQVRRCPDAWQPEFVHQEWRVERRIAADACLSG
jgi:uncharacterized membrane protein YciS (DUF1049 family)